MIDLQIIQAAIKDRLPRKARWMLGEIPFDFDFDPARHNLRHLTDADVVGVPLPEEWSDCLIFGKCDYADGGGASPWIAIHQENGSIWLLDIERNHETMVILNSSIDSFISTFQAFDQHLRLDGRLPEGFANEVNDLDPEVFPSSEWRGIIEMLNDE